MNSNGFETSDHIPLLRAGEYSANGVVDYKQVPDISASDVGDCKQDSGNTVSKKKGNIHSVNEVVDYNYSVNSVVDCKQDPVPGGSGIDYKQDPENGSAITGVIVSSQCADNSVQNDIVRKTLDLNFSGLELGLNATPEVLNSPAVPDVSAQKRQMSRSPSSPPYGRIFKKLSCGNSGSPDLRGRTRSASMCEPGVNVKTPGNWLDRLRNSKEVESAGRQKPKTRVRTRTNSLLKPRKKDENQRLIDSMLTPNKKEMDSDNEKLGKD